MTSETMMLAFKNGKRAKNYSCFFYKQEFILANGTLFYPYKYCDVTPLLFWSSYICLICFDLVQANLFFYYGSYFERFIH